MEGLLLLPPERGTIIGRAVWKPRYVVLASAARFQQHQQDNQQSSLSRSALIRSPSPSRIQAARKGIMYTLPKAMPDTVSRAPADQMWLLVYKQRGDSEPIFEQAISNLKSCEIQNVQHRKPGPSLPTLILTFELDAASERFRKRRSSRTGGLTSSIKEFSNSVLFRTVPEERRSIYDWELVLRPHIRASIEEDSPMSPTSPFASFVNPFAQSRRPSNSAQFSGGDDPGGPSGRNRPELHHRGSSSTYNPFQNSSTRDRPQTSTLISPSPSLRSRRSDLSSQASFTRPIGFNTSFPIQHPPAELPSPASTSGYDDQLISGWTSAQGRSSALSMHTKNSNSVSVSGTPPAPRETILDRAFQMRMIPGSERAGEDEATQLSSIARFEAMMREIDERTSKGKNARETGRKSSMRDWEVEERDDEDNETSDEEAERPATRDEPDVLDLEDEDIYEADEPLSRSIQAMPTPAQRALEYISGRSTPLPQHSHSPTSQNTPPVPRLSDASTFRTKRRERPLSLALPSTTSPRASTMQRQRSNTPTEKNRRFSSTSSLLLVQTNASSSSSHSRASSEVSFGIDDDNSVGNEGIRRGLSQSRLSGMSMSLGGSGEKQKSMAHGADYSKRSAWRGSGHGVFGVGPPDASMI